MPPLMLHFKGNVVITNRYSIQSNVKPHGIIEIFELFQKIVERESPVPLNQFSVKTRNVKTLIRQAAVAFHGLTITHDLTIEKHNM